MSKEKVKKIVIRVDQARLRKTTTVDEMIGLQENNLRLIVQVLSRFVVDENTGDYLNPEEARKLIGQMTMEELEQAGKEFRSRAEEAAVPLANEED